MQPLHKKLAAEAIGTAWLVIGGCGAAIFSGGAAAAVAFGLTVLTMAYAIGHVSGCHLNPAVTIGLFMAKKFDIKDVGPYIAAQIVGAIVGAAILAIIIKTGHSGATLKEFAANGWGDHHPGGYKVVAAMITEFVMTFFFLYIILGSTSPKAPAGFAPIAIGLGLTLVHLISIPITNTSVNPARSISQALFGGMDQIKQLWVFIIFPLAGGVAAGVVYTQLKDE